MGDFFDEHYKALEEVPIFFDKDLLESVIMNGEQPLSTFSLVSFMPRIRSLLDDIHLLAAESSHYSLPVLYRVFYEHSVKATYVWMRAISDNDDSVGAQYLHIEGESEIIGKLRSELKRACVNGKSRPRRTLHQFLADNGVITHSSSKRDLDRKSSAFKVYKMLDYIGTHAQSTKIPEMPSLYQDLYQIYEETSSIVHAMPGSINGYQFGVDLKQRILFTSTLMYLANGWTIYTYLYNIDDRYQPLADLYGDHVFRFLKMIGD